MPSHACIKSLKILFPTNGLCCLDDISDCAMTVFVGSFFLSVPVSSSTLDTSPREKLLVPDGIRAYPSIIAVCHFDCSPVLLMCRVTVRNSIRNREDSIRDESGKVTARIEGRSKSHFYPFRPQDNRLPINIRV